MITFNRRYFFFSIIIFVIEVFIVLFVRDKFVRPYIGDLLVVIFLYALLKAFLKLKVITAATTVLVFACIIEFLQYFKIVHLLGLENSTSARVILGSTFEWEDIFVYMVGIGIVLFYEFKFKKEY